MSSNVSRRKFLGLAGAAVGLGAAGYYGLNSLTQGPPGVELPADPGALDVIPRNTDNQP